MRRLKRAVYLYGGVQSSLYTAMVSDRDDTHYYRERDRGRTGIMAMRSQSHDVVIIRLG